MALIDKASLLMVPSTYEEGTLYNVLPSGNRAPDSTDQNSGYDQTRADFTFDRGSNAAATRIGSDGLIKKYRENLYTESNNFSDSDWSPKAGTFAKGVTDPNGGTDAWSWTATNTDPYLYQAIGTSGVFTLSIYAKGVGSTIGKVLEFRNGSTTQNFTLTSEWQRFELYAAAGGSNIGFEFGNPAVAGDVLHIYAAQWETGLVATDYLDSGATTAKAGVLIDLPRINYDANGENGALLLEPSRTQLVKQSEYYSGSDWISSNVTITDNVTTSPEGLQNASLINFTSSGNYFQHQGPAIVSGSTYTISCYVKRAISTDQVFKIYGNNNKASANLTATSEWQRFTHTFTADSTNFASGLSAPSTAQIHLYGFQVELGSYSTSYIPNHGESGGVTRAADSCFADNIGQTTAYTIFLDYGDLEQAESNFQDYISFQASGSNQNGLRAEGVGSAWRLYGYGISGSVSFPINGSVSAKKKAIVVSTAGIKLFEDGALADEDLSGMTIPALGAITTKRGTSAPYPVEIKNSFKQIAVFNEALSNAECISLTS